MNYAPGTKWLCNLQEVCVVYGTFGHSANVCSIFSVYSVGTLEEANLMQGYHYNTYNHNKMETKQ